MRLPCINVSGYALVGRQVRLPERVGFEVPSVADEL